MAIQLTGKEFEHIRDVFVIIDKDGNGHLTYSELKQCFEDCDEGMINFYLKIMDVDGNGTVEFADFLEMSAFFDHNKRPNEWQIKQMFRALDKDNNGTLSADEIRQFCKMFSTLNTVDVGDELSIEELIQSLDTNGDGEINYLEFVKNYCHLENSEFFSD